MNVPFVQKAQARPKMALGVRGEYEFLDEAHYSENEHYLIRMGLHHMLTEPFALKLLSLSNRAFNIIHGHGLKHLFDLYNFEKACFRPRKGLGRTSMYEIAQEVQRIWKIELRVR